MDKQLGTRAGTLFYASHACEERHSRRDVVPCSDDAERRAAASPADKTPARSAARRLGGRQGSSAPSRRQDLKRSWNLVRTHRDTTVGGTAVQDAAEVLLTRPVTAASEVACNEEVFKNKWTAVFRRSARSTRARAGS